MNPQTGKIIIALGFGIIILGVLIYFFHNKLHWLGRLPGDIRIEKENFSFYFPITTMVLVSIIISGLIFLLKKL